MDDSTALLKQVQAGNQLAARQLVDRYQVKVYNICISLLHNIPDAEDVTQEVFLEVLKHTADFRGDSHIGTWIYRIAVNRSLNFIRSNKKRKWWKQIDDFLDFAGSENTELPTMQQPEPFVLQQQMEQNEQKLILQKAIDALPENQRTAFTLNKIEDFSYKDVADIMKLSHSAVESLIHRARLNLQKSLKLYYK